MQTLSSRFGFVLLTLVSAAACRDASAPAPAVEPVREVAVETPTSSALAVSAASSEPRAQVTDPAPEKPSFRLEASKMQLKVKEPLGGGLVSYGDSLPPRTIETTVMEMKVGPLAGPTVEALCALATGDEKPESCEGSARPETGDLWNVSVVAVSRVSTMQTRARAKATMKGSVRVDTVSNKVLSATFHGTTVHELRGACEKSSACADNGCDGTTRSARCTDVCYCPFRLYGTQALATRYERASKAVQ